MSACPHVLTHASMQRRSKGFVSEMPRVVVHFGTCRHISAHVGTYQHMSECPNVLTHASMQVRSKWFVSEVPRVMLYVGTCRPISTHVGTCRYISAHLGMSTCADSCQHGGKVQMVGTRGAKSGFTCWHMPAHVSRC